MSTATLTGRATNRVPSAIDSPSVAERLKSDPAYQAF